MTLLAWLCALPGFLCLSLAMDRHHRDVFGALPSNTRRQWLRVVGWSALTVAVACCLLGWGAAYGVIVACGVLAAGAAPPLLWLSYRTAPRARPSPRAPSTRASDS